MIFLRTAFSAPSPTKKEKRGKREEETPRFFYSSILSYSPPPAALVSEQVITKITRYRQTQALFSAPVMIQLEWWTSELGGPELRKRKPRQHEMMPIRITTTATAAKRKKKKCNSRRKEGFPRVSGCFWGWGGREGEGSAFVGRCWGWAALSVAIKGARLLIIRPGRFLLFLLRLCALRRFLRNAISVRSSGRRCGSDGVIFTSTVFPLFHLYTSISM